MSEESQQQAQQHVQQQQQRQQLQQQQQNQQQHNNKTLKDAAAGTTTQANTPPNPPRKSNIHEMRNQEFVSRLMAATPPYLYSAPVGPNNFFFSDMLRSLVQARNNENARNLQLQQTILARRPRKRTWSQHRPFYEQFRERKETEEKNHLQQLQQQQQTLANNSNNSEKPLELTNKAIFQLAHKYRKTEEKTGDELKPSLKRSSELPAAATAIVQSEPAGGAVDSSLQNSTPPAASLPPQDLVLPPPPPVWYPSLYPPYGIDPLHFFIDLRVSGHIYDRKKENTSPLTPSVENSTVSAAEQTQENAEKGSAGIGLSQKHRHGSAFSVPVPRTNDLQKTLTTPTTTTDAINLSAATKFENYAKYYDFGESKENQPFSKTASANYMLQHLPRLYSHFAAHVAAPDQSSLLNGSNTDTENKSDCDADSDGRASTDDCPDSNGGNRDIDVEIIDSIKYRTDGESSRSHSRSRCSSGDDASITQID